MERQHPEAARVDHLERSAANVALLSKAFERPKRREAEGKPDDKTKYCRHYPVFNEHLRHETERVKAIHPGLEPDCYTLPSCRSEKTNMILNQLSDEKVRELVKAGFEYKDSLSATIEGVVAETQHQTLPSGLLNTPRFEPQVGDTWYPGAFNACFRMVLNDLSDRQFTQSEVYDALVQSGRGHAAEDEAYLEAFTHPLLSEITQRAHWMRSYMGVDLEEITKVTRNLRERVPDAKVYGIVSMLADVKTDVKELEYLTIWDTGLLLSADEESVTYHHPSNDPANGQAERRMPKQEFLTRWAHTFNRCHLLVAV